jgi:hypothetical protein
MRVLLKRIATLLGFHTYGMIEPKSGQVRTFLYWRCGKKIRLFSWKSSNIEER